MLKDLLFVPILTGQIPLFAAFYGFNLRNRNMPAPIINIEEMQQLPPPGCMRGRFFIALEAQLQQAKADESYLALLRFDIDGFRKLNQQSGYLDADRVLNLLYSRMNGLLLNSDLSCWLGADEFVLLFCVDSKDEIESRVSDLYARLREPCDITTGSYQPRLSLGVALYPDDSLDVEALMLAAEHAQRHAKSRSGAQINYYSNKIHEQAL